MYVRILGTMFACCYVTSYVPALFTRELSVAAASSPYGTQFSPHVLRRVSCNEKVGNGSAKFSVADAVGLLTVHGSDEEELSEDEIIGDFVTEGDESVMYECNNVCMYINNNVCTDIGHNVCMLLLLITVQDIY